MSFFRKRSPAPSGGAAGLVFTLLPVLAPVMIKMLRPVQRKVRSVQATVGLGAGFMIVSGIAGVFLLIALWHTLALWFGDLAAWWSLAVVMAAGAAVLAWMQQKRKSEERQRAVRQDYIQWNETLGESVIDPARKAINNSNAWIRRHPGAALGAAAGLGLIMAVRPRLLNAALRQIRYFL